MQDISDHRIERDITKRALLTSTEGRLLIVGFCLTVAYFVWLSIHLFISFENFQAFLGLTATEIVFGRLACLAFGFSLDFSAWTVIFICMAIETILVLIFYPLFVLIWRQLLVVRWLKRLSDRTRMQAERHKDLVQRYGIIGLFLFVWMPFWMTGPVIGCVIGYLLGLRVWINITTVLIGTYVAILCWAIILRHVHEKYASYSAYGTIVVVLLFAALLSGHLLIRIGHRKNNTL